MTYWLSTKPEIKPSTGLTDPSAMETLDTHMALLYKTSAKLNFDLWLQNLCSSWLPHHVIVFLLPAPCHRCYRHTYMDSVVCKHYFPYQDGRDITITLMDHWLAADINVKYVQFNLLRVFVVDQYKLLFSWSKTSNCFLISYTSTTFVLTFPT